MRYPAVAALLLSCLLSHSSVVMAELGGSVASVISDQASLKASRRVLSDPRYSLHEIQDPSGTVIREYVSPQGQVFGVAWQGPFMPDLQQVLGGYFAEYSSAASNKHGGRGPVLVRRPGLVVRSGGHMRSFSGMAYVPQLLPSDVTADEIK